MVLFHPLSTPVKGCEGAGPIPARWGSQRRTVTNCKTVILKIAACGVAGAASLPSSSQYCPQQPQYHSTGDRISRSKSSLFLFKIAARIAIYIVALVAISVWPCLVNTLSQDEHRGIENSCPIHLTPRLRCGYAGTCLSVRQFVLYCNVLNNGKLIIPCAASKVSAIKRKLW